MSNYRAPALFVPHGGGPLPLLNDASHASVTKYLKKEASKLLDPSKLKAIVLVTAHWETEHPTISNGEKPSLYYDYYGFPQEAYNIKYDPPGSPQVADKVKNLLSAAGFEPQTDNKRGWDHGVFVPMKLLREEGDIPIVQLSVLKSQDPKQLFKYGKALEPLRDEGIAIIGSGMSFHNMRSLQSRFGSTKSEPTPPNNAFEDKLVEVMLSEEKAREEGFTKWREWPGTFDAHPKGYSEHFSPVIVVAGAGGDEKATKTWDSTMWGFRLTSFAFK
eukprot:TRINITY_DN2650_c0_g2_i1.p1 TRINITY_DN2650_c0_g2~~TRINITY_DN2650_c0_g2_i1.p1  ORF type:complete len:274 (+),score=79.62 TRINITY_DN2650_c0_g2_i1:166-987(+)